MGENQLEPGVQGAYGPWARTRSLVGKNIHIRAAMFPLAEGRLRCCLLECRAFRGKGQGEGKMEKDGQPWWEEAISILIMTYLCSGFVTWSK